ncbi:MAG TPA: bifunctional diaminohydroxyphosphoribosylaminopyrimidine deaminase/5-amino-6-(5-phosphoribosylamino)uracil reductase RibD [Gemmatimonadaceae bacterium]|jgi:diaminohydroxyphosphoribosylaminopyrimidine deaminase/5-amino-6-(5-phosphoribosylamino)uracil reductase|nr:bifunctional diaminohydroxyphosphoribosylaminopyrimidine deaminase/5-amino-6-(5-phosphoribosylamino)uracil reductase RibD [Gemmatimonadaceae bacterium]
MLNERDVDYMHRALALAERGWGQTAPNPMVGAVVVLDGEIVGEGAHEHYGGAHAEVNALRVAGERARGATLYVTLEPCDHHGKTPPCTEAIIAAGVARVVMAVRDPNPEAAGGEARLRADGIAIDVGACEYEARELNAPFFHALTATRPWLTLKLAVSVDGAIADANRSPGFITNPQSLEAVYRMRANSDAIAVGVDTAIVDWPTLTARTTPPPRVAPLRVIFDRGGRLPADRTPVQSSDAAPVLVLREPDLSSALGELHRRGVRALLVEGGAGIAAALLEADLVDRLVIFQAPVILGQGALYAFGGVSPTDVAGATRLPVLRRQEFGDDLMTIYALHAV